MKKNITHCAGQDSPTLANQRIKKITIIHDHLLYFGGAERVLVIFLKMYPDSDVYLSFLDPKYSNLLHKLTTGRIFVSPFNHLPLARKFADWFKPALYFYWENLDLSGYDLIISSSHSFSSKAVKTTSNSLHVSYIHTPPRFLYDEYSETQIIKKFPLKYLLAPILSWMRKKDYLVAQRPDILVANSQTVQKRIKKYYHRNSQVIYPPVVLPKKVIKNHPKLYFLCVSRLVKQKGIDLAIMACNQLKAPLVIIGEGKEYNRLRRLAGPTVEFRGFVDDDKMSEIYAGTKALIYCSMDEDFGLVPVEAMARGVPVIAYASGGVLETIVDGKTGILFKDFTVNSLVEAMIKFENTIFSYSVLKKQAARFSDLRFSRQFKDLVNKAVKKIE